MGFVNDYTIPARVFQKMAVAADILEGIDAADDSDAGAPP